MNLIKKFYKETFFYVFIVFIYYTIFCIVIFSIMFISFKDKNKFTSWPIEDLQRAYYMQGFRNIWQNTSCAISDNNLIYKPKNGECFFDNLEFDTKLNFSQEGRHVPARLAPVNKNINSIVILGDSFAMGWGVNDQETFANILQEKIQRPIYNLGVSSYGTHREILRLLYSGLLESSDTIFIQYCDNDLEENLQMSKTNYDKEKMINKFNRVANKHKKNTSYKSLEMLIHTIYRAPKVFFRGKKQYFTTHDFNNHIKAFKDTLLIYNSEFKEKKIIVFYINAYGNKFENFPYGQDASFKNLFFYDLHLESKLFYSIDGHLNPEGHKVVANKLLTLVR